MSRVALITFGRGGHTVYYLPEQRYGGTVESKTEGYDDPETLQSRWTDDYAEHQLENGTVPVIDLRARVEAPGGVALVIEAPLVKPGLEETERFSDLPADFAEPIMAAGFGMTGLVTAARKKKYSGLDFVPVAAYVDYWRENGARIGSWDGTSYAWES